MEVRNRQVRRKVDPETIEGMETRISHTKDAIERGRVIVENLKDNPGWVALCLNFREELEDLEHKMENFTNYDERVRDVMLKRWSDLREFVTKIEKMEQTVLDLNETISGQIANLNERKARLRTASV